MKIYICNEKFPETADISINTPHINFVIVNIFIRKTVNDYSKDLFICLKKNLLKIIRVMQLILFNN